MMRKILIIFIFFGNQNILTTIISYEKTLYINDKVDSVNRQDLIATLSGKYQEFRHVSEELVKNQTNYLTRMMSNMINGFRSYLIAEPTEKETKEADEAMADA
jgi:transcription elongation factor GreA-like protein